MEKIKLFHVKIEVVAQRRGRKLQWNLTEREKTNDVIKKNNGAPS